MSLQFPLQFEFQANKGFDTFYPATNGEIITELQELISGKGERFIFLYGNAGYGKSHLLQASCQFAHQRGMNPFYFPFNSRKLPTLAMFEGLEYIKLVCFDDVDEIAGLLDWEQALLNFFNQHLENNHRLVLSACSHPDDLNIKHPDLKSQLLSGLALQLHPLADEESVSALICKAHSMGLTITPKVGHFLLSHYAHDLPSLWILLGQLDKATLSAQRKLTIPFLKQILEE
jgi:DnaA family protein